MIEIDKAIHHLLPDRFTEEDKATVEDVLDAAMEWAEGRMSLSAAARVGTIAYQDRPSDGYARFVAVATTPVGDARRQALDRMLDEMIRLQGHVATQHGAFTRAELAEHDAAVRWHRSNTP